MYTLNNDEHTKQQKGETGMSKIKNPYRKSSKCYHEIFDAIHATGQKGITRQALLDMKFPPFSVTVILSPRESSKIGYAGGNRSARGKDICMKLPARKIINGVKEPQRFVVARRKKPLGARPERITVAQVKTKTKAAVKSVKSATKAKAIA
jgi:hypothetical protein